MSTNIQCPICGNTNTVILENNSHKILKLRYPGLLFSSKELANKFTNRCFCDKCNLMFKYNEVTGYSIENVKSIEHGVLSALWEFIDIKLCYSDSVENLFIDNQSRHFFVKYIFENLSISLNETDLLIKCKSEKINNVRDLVYYIKKLR